MFVEVSDSVFDLFLYFYRFVLCLVFSRYLFRYVFIRLCLFIKYFLGFGLGVGIDKIKNKLGVLMDKVIVFFCGG